MTVCSWEEHGGKGWHCDHPATHVMTYGCVHEHLRSDVTCQCCLDYARAVGLICTPCYLLAPGDGPHSCESRIVSVTVIQNESGREREDDENTSMAASAGPGAAVS